MDTAKRLCRIAKGWQPQAVYPGHEGHHQATRNGNAVKHFVNLFLAQKSPSPCLPVKARGEGTRAQGNAVENASQRCLKGFDK